MNAKSLTPAAAPTGDGFAALDACHQQVMQMIGELADLADALQLDADAPQARERARRITRFFNATARGHHADEETHVFPPLLASGNEELIQAVRRLQQDHGWLEQNWLELEPHLDAIAAGVGGYDLDLLREGLEVFAALYREHIELEESHVYPEARARISAADRRDIGRCLAARRYGEARA